MKRSLNRKFGRSAIVGTVLLLGIGLLGTYLVFAQDITQPPSAFSIEADGMFTTPEEWSDVEPAVRANGASLVYTSADPGLEALYLMYDEVWNIIAGSGVVGPVHFHNSGAQFDVFFDIGSNTIIAFKDLGLLDLTPPEGAEPSIQGAAGFGPSPNSNIPHQMFELEVLFDDSDQSLEGHVGSHGEYSPDPSHWGAGFQPQPPDPKPVPRDPTPECPDRQERPGDGGVNLGSPAPAQSDFNGDQDNELNASNACVDVVRGSGGRVEIILLPIPGERPIRRVRIDIKPGSFPNSINRGSRGTIPVAILSTPGFDATTQVDLGSLRFGRTGDEDSLAKCTKSTEDANGDGVDDRVCHFDTQGAGFQSSDIGGHLRGRTVAGVSIVGSDSVRILR